MESGDKVQANGSDVAGSSPTTGVNPSREGRREVRERERQERVNGKLTNVTFKEISCLRNGALDYIVPDVVVCLRGSRSQFDARSGRMRALLPPLTGDCCQTFATLAAVILSSLGGGVFSDGYLTTSTVNYILYIAAWMHQLTRTSWPQRGVRPTLGDLNTTLHLQDFFPSKVMDKDFEVLFYNQSARALDLLRSMCVPHSAKRQRNSDGGIPTRGYIIVSGDYTVSIFSAEHQQHPSLESESTVQASTDAGYTDVWTFFICDSHGTQPWSQGKASVTSITFGAGVDSERDPASTDHKESVMRREDGLKEFATILFALLEEHRKHAPKTNQAPYMTWTPMRRRRGLVFTPQELEKIIDAEWWPKILSNRTVNEQARAFNFKPIRCFWATNTGAQPTQSASTTSVAAKMEGKIS